LKGKNAPFQDKSFRHQSFEYIRLFMCVYLGKYTIFKNYPNAASRDFEKKCNIYAYKYTYLCAHIYVQIKILPMHIGVDGRSAVLFLHKFLSLYIKCL